jgi:pimeloyl-ACP methyl ester carboxylesterase
MTTCILLRGLTREAGHWGHFPDELRSALGDATVAAIDLPGAGALNGIRSPTGIDAIATQCRAQALALGLQPPFHLVALSLGAMVAIAWARRHPDEIAAAVLINTSLASQCPPWRRLRPAAWPALLRLLLPATDALREAIIYRLTSNRPASEDATVKEWVSLRQQHPVAAANAFRQLWAAARYRPPAPPKQTRLLVLASRGDHLVDPDCSRYLAQSWHTDYAEHPDAGHDLPLDDGTWVAARIADWLKGMG